MRDIKYKLASKLLVQKARFLSSRHNTEGPLKAFWWRYHHPYAHNIGDELTELIVNRLFGRDIEWSAADRCDFVACGSVLEVVQSAKRTTKVHVWGAGYIQEGPKERTSNLIYHGVRGKLTSDRINVSSSRYVALADPGLLCSLVWRRPEKKIYDVGIVPHYVDHSYPQMAGLVDSGVKFINVLHPPDVVIKEIKQCRSIISSSLHGLIIADSFQIPNVRTKWTNNLTGGDYKFNDYYSVFGHRSQSMLDSQILEKLDPEVLLRQVVKLWEKPTNIERLQYHLIKAYPNI